MNPVDNIRRPQVHAIAKQQILENTLIWTDEDKNLRNLTNVDDKNYKTESVCHDGRLNENTGKLHIFFFFFFCVYLFIYLK